MSLHTRHFIQYKFFDKGIIEFRSAFSFCEENVVVSRESGIHCRRNHRRATVIYFHPRLPGDGALNGAAAAACACSSLPPFRQNRAIRSILRLLYLEDKLSEACNRSAVIIRVPDTVGRMVGVKVVNHCNVNGRSGAVILSSRPR